MAAADKAATAEQGVSAWRDPLTPVPDRAETLLAEMPLEEKAGQLGSRWVGNEMAGGDLPCRATARLTGPTRVAGHDRNPTAPVTISPQTTASGQDDKHAGDH